MNRIKNVRFGLLAAAAVALLIAGGVFSSSPVSADGPTLVVDSITLAPGQSGSIDVTADVADPGLGAWNITITNEGQGTVNITGCTSHATGVCNARADDNGPVSSVGAAPNGLIGETVLVTIDVTCKSTPGSSDFTVQVPVDTFVDATLGGPQDLTPKVTNGTVTCESTSPTDTPVPPTDVPGEPTDTPDADASPTIGGPDTGFGGSSSNGGVSTWLLATLAGMAIAAATGFGVLRLSARRS